GGGFDVCLLPLSSPVGDGLRLYHCYHVCYPLQVGSSVAQSVPPLDMQIAIARFLASPYRLLSNHGIRGPTPLPLLGNFLSINKVGHDRFLEEQIETFGKVFGYYVGTTPKVAITDVEIAKEIMVKEFENFSDRGFIGPPSLIPKALGVQPGMIVSSVEIWRPGRRALTPSFSAMKMKLMVPLIKKSTGVLLDILGGFAESDKSVEVFGVYGGFTMETLMATAFGQDVAVQRGEGDQVSKAADTVFRAAEEGSALSVDVLGLILSSFPCLEPLILRAVRNSEAGSAVKLMNDSAIHLIEARMQSQHPPKVKDLLQLMIDATVDEDNGDNSSRKKLTSTEIAGFSVDFFLAGYETTATTLGFTSYLLAMNTHVQEKLQVEIDEYFEENPVSALIMMRY
ncbi:Cytochrome P450 3A24, partial [Geodia barretti]